MTKKNYLTVLLATAALASCDNSDEIGSSIISDDVEIVTASDFKVTGETVNNRKVQSRTITQLLGSINAGEYGSFYSDFVTQFMPSAKIDTAGVIVDGLTLRMAIPRSTGYVGDTLIPMGLEVYELTKPLDYPIYSDFGTKVDGFYDSNKPIASKIYNFTNVGLDASTQALSYIEIPVEMPKKLAQRLFDIYKNNPEDYLIPSRFAEKFPGIYVKSSYGDGRVVKIGATLMTLDYHVDGKTDAGKDTTYNYVGNYYAVSPEIITNNNITYTMSNSLKEMKAQGDKLLVAPIGLDVEIDFPINEILDKYLQGAGKLSVINSLNFTLPVEEIENDYGIVPPPYVLMVRSDKKDEFFAKNNVTDNITSFLGTYNSTDKNYVFPDMRGYLRDRVQNGEATPSETKFTITPVTVNMETNSSSSYYYYGTTTSTVSSIVPYVETPVMTKILLDDAKIVLNYSKQYLKM
ncbi:MAG: DUF4270 domain-containing protein [Clostridiales bacterium]|nr:DUF4270 domain-containing protein [Clostridiales bacterium]